MYRQTNTLLWKLRYLNIKVQKSWRHQSTSVTEKVLSYKAGQNIHGFTVRQVTPVPDLCLTAVQLSHNVTGAEVLHLAREDSNNLFSVQFRTTPRDSTGVPHVLEHAVLCGSHEYPCRDPFFRMLSRSLATFMNAFTASDYTMYPFSTQNGKDFQNLLSIYLDAVFFPNLHELDFWQEVWRLEGENPTDPDSPLVFKGVVFNEMKGAFAHSESLFAQHLQNKLLPAHTYSVVSAGDPLSIPDLSWEQLRRFHTRHYHPSNARFFTYGDLPLEQHLKQIEEQALSRFDQIDPDTAVPPEPRWDHPREYHIRCGSNPLAPEPSKQNCLTVSYLLGDITDTFEALTLNLLSSLMVTGPNSPFYKALIEPKLGSAFSSIVGYDGSKKEASFSIGLQGISEEDMEKIKNIILQTIDHVEASGFEEERIEALLHKIEVQLKHQSTHFGLALALYIAPCWNHDGDPVPMLRIDDMVTRFKQCLKDNPRYLQEKIKQYFKDNKHRLTLSDDDRKEIHEKGLQLLTIQGSIQDASCLPALKVSDAAPVITATPLEMGMAVPCSRSAEVPVQYSPQPTNGMVYFRVLCGLRTLPEDLKIYIPLFCNIITKLGCGSLDYRQQSQQMEMKTGGMVVSPQVVTDTGNLDTYEQGILLTSSCLERNVSAMFDLWAEIFNSPNFEDEERLRVLLMISAQELSNGISSSGHTYAMTRAGHTLTSAGRLQETFDGMDQVQFIQRIVNLPNLSVVLQKMLEIKKYIFDQQDMRCALNATPQRMSEIALHIEEFVERISIKKNCRSSQLNVTEEPTFTPSQMKTYFELPFPVSFIGESVRTVPFTHQDYASLVILSHMMTTKFLHGEIREKGGAYGGGAMMDHSGLFSFYSYRDPNCMQTLSTFSRAVEWAKNGKFSQQDVDEAKLSTFATVDAPEAPCNKGMDHFLNGVSDELKQEHRERLFAVAKQDLIAVATRYLCVGQQIHGIAVLGAENGNIRKDPSWVVR
ncbi:presequence protease, mitochondrial-like isoform X4 [Brienomyrus brachyistius]|uniref:presequence protease, mitochondrial-like isoform X4 n=1 Tax=Brienomyrus brachyistius TaxID=42636 RepID=UPI0020B40B30|nr:presequence protease, mitochondrial-like isoform X4 [Brienomyrus brachyistius]